MSTVAEAIQTTEYGHAEFMPGFIGPMPDPSQETPLQAARRFSDNAIKDGYVPEGLHIYNDAKGGVLYWRIRLKNPETGEKWIRPMRWTGKCYELKERAFKNGKPLYRLDELASGSNELVIITEGEKKADNLVNMGLVATTSGAADSALAADWHPLAGRTIMIWPDNDDAGKRYAEAVSGKLMSLGCTVRVIDVAALDLPPKGDAVDWLASRPVTTAADVLALPCINATIKPVAALSTSTAQANAQIRSTELCSVELLCASDMEPEPIRWLWDGWLACGKFHVLAGAPGTGKTTIATGLAATVTVGGHWPDGSSSEIGNVLIWSGEDDPNDTLIPRLMAQQADRSRVYFVGDSLSNGERRSFDPSSDMAALLLEATRIGNVRLLVVDPIVSAVVGDSHKNAEVRRSLQPLVDLASQLNCAVLGISHFSKGTVGRDPTERVTGSLAFGAVARVVLATAKSTDEDGGHLLVRSKSNIGPDTGGFRYEFKQTEIRAGIMASELIWGEAIEGTARELLAEAEMVADEDRTATDDAEDFLNNVLRTGAILVNDIKIQARQAGISDKPLRKARERMGIKPRKREFSGGWEWALPNTEHSPNDAKKPSLPQDAHSPRQGIFDNTGHLGLSVGRKFDL